MPRGKPRQDGTVVNYPRINAGACHSLSSRRNNRLVDGQPVSFSNG